MPFDIDPSVRRSPSLATLFHELGLSDQDSQPCHKMLLADPTDDLKFGFYLLRLYAQSTPDERKRLMSEDFDKVRAYLYCAKELESHQISIKTHNADTGKKLAHKLPDLYTQLLPHLHFLGETVLPAFVEGVLDSELAPFRPRLTPDTPAKTEKEILANSDAEILLQEGSVKLVRIRTHEGAHHYGRGTAWCTAYLHTDEHYLSYANDGELLVLDTNNGANKYQFHFESGSLSDSKDREVTFSEVCSLCTELEDANSPLRERLLRQLITTAFEDGRKNNYYPFLSLICTTWPADLEDMGVQLAVDLLERKGSWPKNIEVTFLAQIGELSPKNQTLAMDMIEAIASRDDDLIPTFAVTCISEDFGNLTPANQDRACVIYERLKSNPSIYVQDIIRHYGIPQRRAPEASVDPGRLHS